MRKNYLLLTILLLLGGYGAVAASSEMMTELPVIPKPKQIDIQEDRFSLGDGIRVEMPGVKKGDLGAGYQQLVEVFGKGKKEAGIVRLGLLSEDGEFSQQCEALGLDLNSPIDEQGYFLAIRPSLIIVAANTPSGLFYGIQTLIQLHRGFARDGMLPAMTITDWPDYTNRMISDDISRGPIPTRAYMRQQIVRMAEMKLNQLFYYTEHVVRTKSHGDFAPPGAPTIEEYEELSEFAADHFVDLIPNFQSFGHAEKVMAYSQYAHLGEANRLYSPAVPEVYDFLGDVYKELIESHSSQYFAIHCDETFDLGRGASKEMMAELGYGGLWAAHVNKLIDIVKSYGKTPIIWGDVPMNHPEIYGMLPKDILMGVWDYGAADSFINFIEPAESNGFTFIVVPGILNSRRLTPDWETARINIRNFASEGLEHGAWGILTTVWDDGGEAQFSRDWYGIAYAAEQSWSSDRELADEDFDVRFNVAVYDDRTGSITSALHSLNRLTDVLPTAGMNRDIFWYDFLPERDQRLSLNLDGMQDVLDIVAETRAIIDVSRPAVWVGDLPCIRFTIDQYEHLAQSRFDLVAAANAYREAANLQNASRKKAVKPLKEALDLVCKVRVREQKLLSDYVDLWNAENEPYALDWITGDYNRRIDGYLDCEARLTKAMEMLKAGGFLPPITEVRLAIEVVSGNYMQGWLMVGPFHKPTPADEPAPDYLGSIGGEIDATPKVAMEFVAPDGQTFRWFKHLSTTYGDVDLEDLFDKNTEAVVYAYAKITSPKAMRVRATFGSNDGVEIILNHEKVFAWHGKRAVVRDEDEVWLDMVEGDNHLLLKVDQNQGGWGFSFQLPDVELVSRNFRYTILGEGE